MKLEAKQLPKPEILVGDATRLPFEGILDQIDRSRPIIVNSFILKHSIFLFPSPFFFSPQRIPLKGSNPDPSFHCPSSSLTAFFPFDFEKTDYSHVIACIWYQIQVTNLESAYECIHLILSGIKILISCSAFSTSRYLSSLTSSRCCLERGLESIKRWRLWNLLCLGKARELSQVYYSTNCQESDW